MADDIFVGSVSVGVVPDLRGFNTTLRRELVPEAERIGREMGQSITRGIVATLDLGKALRDSAQRGAGSLNATADRVGRDFGTRVGRAISSSLGIGPAVSDSARRGEADTARAGDRTATTFARSFKTRFDREMRGYHPNVTVDVKADVTRARADIAKLSRDITVRVNTDRSSLSRIASLFGGGSGSGSGGSGLGNVAGAAGNTLGGGLNFSGGLTGLFSSLPTEAKAALIGAAAAAAPFIAQTLGGAVVAGFGSALAGLGIAGAVGIGGTTAQDTAKARGALEVAQGREAAAQLRLNKLRDSGKASAAQLASAETSLLSAQNSVANAQTKYRDLQKTQMTAGQEAVRQSFSDLVASIKGDLATIGVSFQPVLLSIASTAQSVLGKLTPVFANAVKIISGPFQEVANVLITSFTDPQVVASITAIAEAFAKILTAFAPDIPGIVNSFADAIVRIAQAISKNPKAFADFLNFLFQIGVFALNIIAILTYVASWIETNWPKIAPLLTAPFKVAMDIIHGNWSGLYNDIVGIGRTLGHDIAVIWNLLWTNIVVRTIHGHQFIQHEIDQFLHGVANQFDLARHDIAHIWDLTWNAVKGAAIATWNGIRRIFASFIVDGILGPLGTILHGAAVAFGWIPGIGPKLKAADKAFQAFATSVNNSLAGINDKTVTVSVNLRTGKPLQSAPGTGGPNPISRGAAYGGYIGYGTGPTSDDVPAWLSRGEYVMPANAVSRYGVGFMDMLRAQKFAAGGLVLDTSIPSAQSVGKSLWAQTVKVVQANASAILGAMLVSPFSGITGVPSGPAISGSAAAAMNFAKSILWAYGWTMAQWPALQALWMGESGWNYLAYNASSGATGIPQSLPGSKMASAGADWRTNPATQIRWGLGYISATYGSPANAYGLWLSRSPHWYAAGTGSDGAQAGWAWVGEQGPELVHFKGGETVVPNAVSMGYQHGTVSARAVANAHARAIAAAATKMANAGATLAARLAKVTPTTTAATYASNQALFLKDLRLYFDPRTAQTRSVLVIRQIAALQSLETHIKTLSANVASATQFQQQELAHLRASGGITSIGIQGVGAAGGRSVLAGLNAQVANVRSFGNAIRDLSRAGADQSLLKTVAGMDPASGAVYGRKMVTVLNALKSMKLPGAMVNQLIAAGPDAALAYVDAIRAAGPSTLAGIRSAERTLEAAQLAVSRGTASVVSGGAYITGANFVAGLKSQEKALEAQFRHLGKALGEEAVKWMRVPANKRPYGYAQGGWLNEPVSGTGIYTGSFYTFAERGREYIVPERDMKAGQGGPAYHAHFDGLTGAAIESHVQTAFQAMALTQGYLQRQGRRS